MRNSEDFNLKQANETYYVITNVQLMKYRKQYSSIKQQTNNQLGVYHYLAMSSLERVEQEQGIQLQINN